MSRRLGLIFMTAAFMVAALGAQEDPARPKAGDTGAKKADPKKNLDDLPPIKELEKKERAPEPADANDPQRVQKIIERLHKNMDSSEERLGKEDPGEETRKIQDNIVKDLDELIKQSGKGGGGGGGGGEGGMGGGGSGKSVKSSSGKGRNSAKAGGQAKGQPQDQQANPKGGGAQPNDADQTAKNKEGKGGGGMGGDPDKKETKEKNSIEDLFKDVWGHLPQNKRQEMDAYAKERFLRKYDEILRQYYRTISEQGRRKDGD